MRIPARLRPALPSCFRPSSFPRFLASALRHLPVSIPPLLFASLPPRVLTSASSPCAVSSPPRVLTSASPLCAVSSPPRVLTSASPPCAASSPPRVLTSASPPCVASSSPHRLFSSCPRVFASSRPRLRLASPPRLIGIDASRAARARRTGTETYSLELIKALANLASPQHRLRLYTPHPPQHTDWPTSPYLETRVIAWPRLWTHLRLAAELWRHPPDVLFVPAHVLPVYCPVPAVVTVHDLGYRHYPEAHRPFDRWYLDWTTRRHSRLARRLIADSLATKQDLIDFYGASPDRITVVYLGRDEKLAPVSDPRLIAQTKARYGLAGDYLLYLGTLHPRKNLIRLIDAFHLAIGSLQNETLKLVIAGKPGWLYHEIYGRIQRLGLAGRVILPGYITEEAKPALLSGALAYVFPSLYEGFGLPVLEAMACGAPVLTSNCSSLPEVAGTAALLVDPHNTAEIAAGLIELMTNANLRRQLIEDGYRQIEGFSWQKAARQVLEIVENTDQL